MTEKVGLIGPGLMGQPMGMNLLKAGYPLWVYSRTAERSQPLADEGAIVCATPRVVAENADIIITIVSSSDTRFFIENPSFIFQRRFCLWF